MELEAYLVSFDPSNEIVEMSEVEVLETFIEQQIYKGMRGFYYGTIRNKAIVDLLDNDGKCYRTIHIPKGSLKLCQ